MQCIDLCAPFQCSQKSTVIQQSQNLHWSLRSSGDLGLSKNSWVKPCLGKNKDLINVNLLIPHFPPKPTPMSSKISRNPNGWNSELTISKTCGFSLKRMNLHQSLTGGLYFTGTIKQCFENFFSAYFTDLFSYAGLLSLLSSKYMSCKHSSGAQHPTA